MENITPTLILLWDVKHSLEKGLSVASGIQFFCKRNSQHFFFKFVRLWLRQVQTGQVEVLAINLNTTQRHLLVLLEYGLKGQSILDSLKKYEAELIISCEDEIQEHIAKLPLILLAPLMGLIFPSIIILLVWPILSGFQL